MKHKINKEQLEAYIGNLFVGAKDFTWFSDRVEFESSGVMGVDYKIEDMLQSITELKLQNSSLIGGIGVLQGTILMAMKGDNNANTEGKF
jgi:hypothetical protein